MTPPSPADAASSEDASDGGTSQREERILDSTERASLGPLTAINEALMDASLGAILEGLRAAVAGEQSHVWSPSMTALGCALSMTPAYLSPDHIQKLIR